MWDSLGIQIQQSRPAALVQIEARAIVQADGVLVRQ